MSRNYQEHPEWFPWVEETTRRIEREHNNAFDRFLAEQEALQAACLCEYDGGYGDDGSIVKRFPNCHCPIHREEDQEEEMPAEPDSPHTVEFRGGLW